LNADQLRVKAMTHFTIDKGQTMNTPSTLRLIIASLACIVVVGLVGCDDSAQLRGMNNEEAESTDQNKDEEDDEEEQEETVDHQPMDEEGHGTGPDEQELIEPGFMNGSWRVATDEQNTPAVYFDTFQDKGETQVSGTYLMALGIYERLDGESGNLEAASSFDGDTLILEWNPTNDAEEVLTLQATRVDENTLEGRVTAKRNVEMDIPVKLTRQTEE
jgi:hypothetical protein